MKIDFTNATVDHLKIYGGANGSKIGIIYENENYMLKFPLKVTRNPMMDYANSGISEHAACQIFKSLGIETQDTLLGFYKNKLTVACKDFEVDGYLLKDFAHLKNTILDSRQNGYGTELSDILKTIHEQQLMSPDKLENYFWEMFVCDAFLGNFDRHNGNWGFLINADKGDVKIAPIYDCASCLYPQINENQMKTVLASKEEIKERVYVFPTSAIQNSGKKINYAQFLLETDDQQCIKALRSVSERIDMAKIESIIREIPYIGHI